MTRRTAQRERTGATAVEAAIVLPITFFLMLGLVVGGMGVFRYHELAFLAREGARYASVHGKTYESENTGVTAATAQDVYEKAILPRAVSLDRSRLTYSVSWSDPEQKGYPTYFVDNDYENPRITTVTVTVSYEWFPELYLAGPYTLRSTSTVPMFY
jgi:Flp pilus assembly protein TadG